MPARFLEGHGAPGEYVTRERVPRRFQPGQEVPADFPATERAKLVKIGYIVGEAAPAVAHDVPKPAKAKVTGKVGRDQE